MKKKGVKAGEQELWGHLSNVRGYLGEALAFTDKAVLADRDAALAAAQDIAKRLGPGHDAVWLTQVENGIRYADGGEGPDGVLILIRNATTGEAYVHTAYQVKAARSSSGFPQSVNDVYREAGVFRAGGWEPGRGMVTPGCLGAGTRGGPAPHGERTGAAACGRCELRSGATNQEVGALKVAGFIVDEQVLWMSVDQATHLAVSMQQAAVREGLASGRLKP